MFSGSQNTNSTSSVSFTYSGGSSSGTNGTSSLTHARNAETGTGQNNAANGFGTFAEALPLPKFVKGGSLFGFGPGNNPQAQTSNNTNMGHVLANASAFMNMSHTSETGGKKGQSKGTSSTRDDAKNTLAKISSGGHKLFQLNGESLIDAELANELLS